MTDITLTQKWFDRLDILETLIDSQVINGRVDDSEAESPDESLLTDERRAHFLWYWHLAVNVRGGIRLLSRNIPLRASRVTVYADDVKYRVHGGSGGTIYTPSGNGGSASSSFRYPGFNRYGVVLFQPGSSLKRNITGTSPSSAQTFSISNGRDIAININDTNSDGAYRDNWGSFNIWIRVDQS